MTIDIHYQISDNLDVNSSTASISIQGAQDLDDLDEYYTIGEDQSLHFNALDNTVAYGNSSSLHIESVTSTFVAFSAQTWGVSTYLVNIPSDDYVGMIRIEKNGYIAAHLWFFLLLT